MDTPRIGAALAPTPPDGTVRVIITFDIDTQDVLSPIELMYDDELPDPDVQRLATEYGIDTLPEGYALLQRIERISDLSEAVSLTILGRLARGRVALRVETPGHWGTP